MRIILVITTILLCSAAAQPQVYAGGESLLVDNDTAITGDSLLNDTIQPIDTAITSEPLPNDTIPSIDTAITREPLLNSNITVSADTAAVLNTAIIRGIEVYGNATTRPEILELFFDFEIGDTLDASKLAATRTRLLRSEIYESADIFPHIREDGAHIFVVLKEAVRVSFSGGLTYYTYKRGREDLWLVANADASLSNFRGRLEEISLGAELWERRSASLYWHKPFLSNPYYISAAASVSRYPDEALPVDYLDAAVKATLGRSVSQHSRVYVSAVPIYRRRSVVEPPPGDSACRLLDSIAFRDKNDFFEAFGAAGFMADFRQRRFDPQSGWSLNSELRTNRVYSGVNTPFFQLRSELRCYLPLLFDDMAALRLALTLRDTDAGAYHRLTAGGTGSLRGYHEQALGWRFAANSSIIASVKYHKPVWETPRLPFPVLGAVYGGRNEITYRIDAALIADYALLFREPLGALTFNGQWEDGIGLGFGTRIAIPEIRQSGCIDLVFGGGAVRKPMLHIYFDLFY